MRPLSCFVAVVGSILALSPAALADGWPSFRGGRGDGRALSGLPPGDGALAFAHRWTKPLGSGYSGIVVDGDLLVTAGRAGDEDVVVALATADGSERWRVALGPFYAGHGGSHDGPIATPAIADGRVFIISPRGRLLALEAASGRVLWSHEIATELALAPPYYGSASSPVVVDGKVVLWVGGEPGRVAAFDTATGALRWQQLEEPTDAQSPVVATLAGKEQVVVIGGTHVAGLDPRDGAILWQLAHQGSAAAMAAPTSSPLVLGDDRILFKHGADGSMIVRVTRTEAGFAATVERQLRALARSYSPPAVGGELVFGFSGLYLTAVDPAAGNLLWRSREPGDGFLVAVEDQLVVLTKEGSLHLGPASATAWSESARLDLFDELAWSPPSVVGSSIYARSLGGIARVDLVRGEAAPAAAAVALPASLAPLATELATAADPAAAINAFLAGKELPLVDGEDVVFLWRGRGSDVAIGGDMIGMRRAEPMHRLGSTDLWWWAIRLDRRARVSYVFLIDNEPAVDPAHGRRVAATVLGPDLNWQRAQGLQMSWLAMPDWPGHALAPSAARGRIERFELQVPKPGTTTGETAPVEVAVWLPPGYDAPAGPAAGRLPVVYVHHEEAFEHGGWPETLDRVVGRTVEPLLAVFVRAPRGVDASPHFADLLVPAIDARYRTRAGREGRASVGMGFSSHGALLLALQHPELVAALGIQSWYAVPGEMMDEVETALTALDPATHPLRVYLEWGRWDLRSPHEGMDMQASSQWLYGKLQARELAPIGGEVADSTDFASWRNRTDVLLETLFPASGTTGAGVSRWLLPPAPAAP